MNSIEEKKILIQIIGALEALKCKSITLIECEKYLFSPRIAKELLNRGFDKRISEIVYECCELEDIDSLIPDSMTKCIDTIKNKTIYLLSIYEPIENCEWCKDIVS